MTGPNAARDGGGYAGAVARPAGDARQRTGPAAFAEQVQWVTGEAVEVAFVDQGYSGERRHADGKLVMFLAIDRVSTFTYVEFHDSAGQIEGAALLRNVVGAFPYIIHTVLTERQRHGVR
ncbi:hypothetical protein FHR87_003716 [Azomonas macrocytogenes]|uniref:Uncharacterized protein n=1 Tax=Azomonas macrocytogenes TaxID=69962 RepID=A0A839T8T4_AZOMA|nr:hypothetical protein [Azomonas macrocytogenes]